ncbi:hypothetical protein [Trichococcus shcherbakoviae]|uniref:hypothetical protein n=1 Tax=Trichococcus shcherbakoviae TaxID=2094020 RepID=UPI0029F48731|nr:hypothetical protein [Trichococcus shcherbakoviae]
MVKQFYKEQICEKCGKTSYIYKIHYPAPDGYEHECSCSYCDYTFFQIKKKSLDDYIAYKEKK